MYCNKYKYSTICTVSESPFLGLVSDLNWLIKLVIVVVITPLDWAVIHSGKKVQHGRYLGNWYLEAGRHLEASEADTEVGVL